jgi:hypothetical protein
VRGFPFCFIFLFPVAYGPYALLVAGVSVSLVSFPVGVGERSCRTRSRRTVYGMTFAEAVMFPSPAAFHSYFPFQMPRCAYVASDIRTIISPGYPSTVILGFSIHVPDSPRVHGSPR